MTMTTLPTLMLTVIILTELGGDIVAQFSPEFGRRFSKLLKDHGLSAFAAEKFVEYNVRHSTIRSWCNGCVPTVDKFAKVLTYFPEQDPKTWMEDMLGKA